MATVMLQWQRRAAATETGWLTKPRHNWALYTKRFAGPCGKAATEGHHRGPLYFIFWLLSSPGGRGLTKPCRLRFYNTLSDRNALSAEHVLSVCLQES